MTGLPTITYAGHEIAVASLPAQSIEALLRRGVTHFLGNEQAAKVTARAKKDEATRAVEAFKAAHGRDPSESDTLPSVAPASDENRDTWKAEYIANAIKALAEGTVGLIVRGPSVDPVDARMEKIAKAEVLNVLKGAGIKVPKKDEAVTFADGTKKTLDDMIETRLERFGDRIRVEAEKALKAEAKAKEKARVEAASAESKTADALGL